MEPLSTKRLCDRCGGWVMACPHFKMVDGRLSEVPYE